MVADGLVVRDDALEGPRLGLGRGGRLPRVRGVVLRAGRLALERLADDLGDARRLALRGDAVLELADARGQARLLVRRRGVRLAAARRRGPGARRLAGRQGRLLRGDEVPQLVDDAERAGERRAQVADARLERRRRARRAAEEARQRAAGLAAVAGRERAAAGLGQDAEADRQGALPDLEEARVLRRRGVRGDGHRCGGGVALVCACFV